MPYRSQSPDTSEAADRMQFELLRRMSSAEKLEIVTRLYRATEELALTGLRDRYPEASERELFMRLAVFRLGADVVEQVYGWREPVP